MHRHTPTRIDESIHQLIAENGTQFAIALCVNLDDNAVVGVYAFHEYDGSYVVESGSVRSVREREQFDRGYLDKHHKLFPRDVRSREDAVRSYMETLIDSQKQSSIDTTMLFEVIEETTSFDFTDELRELSGTIVGPDRLTPPFDEPAEGDVVEIDCSSDVSHIIEYANEQAVGTTLERFRGVTYLVGVSEDELRTLTDKCFKLQNEYSDKAMYEAAENASRAETKINNACNQLRSSSVR